MTAKKQRQAILYDGRYWLRLEYSDSITPDSGKYISPSDNEPGVITVNPDQPEFDQAVALSHELWHHIAWTREAKSTFVSHAALEYHACQFMSLLQNSPKLAEYYYLFSKKGG